MSPKAKRTLSVVDIKFLKAVKEINENPDQYEDTGGSQKPANTRSIGNVTDLSKTQRVYRLRPDERGLERMGYVDLFEPEQSGQEIGPRSAGITDEGIEAIRQWEEEFVTVDVGPSDRDLEGGFDGEVDRDIADALRDLQAEIEDLSQRVERIEQEIEGEFGAVSESRSNQLSKSINLVILYHEIFEDIFGIPVEDLDEEVPFDQARERVRDRLGIAEGDFDSVDSGDAPIETE